MLRALRVSVAGATVPVAVVTGDYFIEEPVVAELERLGAAIHFKPLWDTDLLRLVADLIGPARIGS